MLRVYVSTLWLDQVTSLSLFLGTLMIKQVNTETSELWPVEGIATYEFSGCCPAEFEFQCLTDDSGLSLNWRKGNAAVDQTAIVGGVKFALPTQSSAAGVYTCSARDGTFQVVDSISINITAGKCMYG